MSHREGKGIEVRREALTISFINSWRTLGVAGSDERCFLSHFIVAQEGEGEARRAHTGDSCFSTDDVQLPCL